MLCAVRLRVSLDQPMTSSDGGRDLAERDVLADPYGHSAQRDAERNELLQQIMQGLSAEERLVIDLYDLRGLTMRQAGQVIGISESRVSQLRVCVIKRLRGRFAGSFEVA